LEECQLDELWTFIYKKEKQLTALEKLAEVYGDAWVWIAFSPVCKLVPAWVVGKRTLPHARRLVFRLKSASDGQIPFFTSDELPHYADALLEVYGEQVQPQRQGTRGRFPKPYRVPPPDLCYAVVVKNVSKDAWWKSPHVLFMAQRSKWKQRLKHRLSAVPSILMA